MLRSLRGGSPAYPQKQCFFCQATSVILPPFQPNENHPIQPPVADTTASTSALTISTGTADNWFCSSCQCWNAYHEDGSFKDQWMRPMWDDQWNQDRSKLLKHQAAKQSKAFMVTDSKPIQPIAPERPFCHTCQTNQTLQFNLLADYLPNQDDPTYKDKVEALPAYRASIAARYPSVCASCAPSIQSKIEERDRMARSWTLAQWLGKPENAEAASLVKNQTEVKGGEEDERSAISARRARLHAEIRWYRQGVCWLLSSLISLTCYALGLRRPEWVQEAILVAEYLTHEEPLSLANAAFFLGVLAMLFLFSQGAQWDPTSKRAARARSRGIRAEVTGKVDWRFHQKLLFIARRLVVAAVITRVAFSSLLRHSEPLNVFQTLSIGALATEAIMLFLSVRRLRVKMPRALRLVSKPLYAARPSADPFDSLSLSDPPVRTTQGFDSLFHQSSLQARRDPDGDEIMGPPLHDDADDDDPPPPQPSWDQTMQSQTEAHDFQLGKQRFWEPERPTGLEEVFGKVVRLDDDEQHHRESGRWKKLLGLGGSS